MKLAVKREALAQGMSIVIRAVPSRTAIPILSHVLMATDEGDLRLTATDMELTLTVWVPVEQLDEEGATAVEARTFHQIISKPIGEQLELTYQPETHVLYIHGPNTDIKMQCLPADDFPPVVAPEAIDGSLTLPASVWREIIKQVRFAASTDEARPVLTGISVRTQGHTVTFAATDSYRLSVRRVTLETPLPAWDIIIPARAFGELQRLAKDGENEIRMSVSTQRQQAIFRTERAELITQLIEGRYPEYERIIPERFNTRVVASRDLLLRYADIAQVIASLESNIIRLSIQPSEDGPGAIVITGRGEANESKAVISAVVEGEPLEVAFNARYFIEALSAVPTPDVVMEFVAPASPVVIKPTGRDDFLHILMPMQLSA
ncbi:MAG: DNA polymerase III subunit beta [Chloroflexi bacterium]|nr:DNA polymerase III subunit beta [Chloroflexota bacterium]